MAVQQIERGPVLVSELLGHPDHHAGFIASSVSEQLAQMAMVCLLQLILYDYVTIPPHLSGKNIQRKTSNWCFC